MARPTQSAVRIRFSKASSARLENGRCWAISCFNGAKGTPGNGFARPVRWRAAANEPGMAAAVPGWATLLLHDFQIDGELDVVSDCGGGEVRSNADVLTLVGG